MIFFKFKSNNESSDSILQIPGLTNPNINEPKILPQTATHKFKKLTTPKTESSQNSTKSKTGKSDALKN